MTQINTDNLVAGNTGNVGSSNSLENLDLDVFLELMLAELQNQDPLDPTDNSELLDQIGQIREISSNDKLTETLDSVLLGQNVSTAANLIGTEVEGLTDRGQRVVGAVQQVSINDGEPVLTLATEPTARSGTDEGSVESGNYTYEITWEAEGTILSVTVSADTDSLDDFLGSIRLDNLPETSVPKTVYRTDKSGSGELKQIGVLPGETTAFTDQLGDDERGEEEIPASRQILRFADAVEVRLSNVSTVETLR